MFWIVLVLVFITVWLFYNFCWKRKGLPPGPIPLPLIGNILTIRKLGFETYFQDLKSKYGDIHTFWFGECPVVAVTDAATILETFVKNGEVFAGRPTNMFVTYLTRRGRYGLIFTDGPIWRDHRRFTLQVLRDFGFGKNLMQEKILYEVPILIEEIRDKIGQGQKEISIQAQIDICVGSIINNLLFGYSFSKTKPSEFYTVKSLMKEMLIAFGHPLIQFCNRSPFMFKLFPFMYTHVIKMSNNMRHFFLNQIDVHRNKIDFETDNEPTDFVEAFLRKRYALEKDGIFDHSFNDDQLYGISLDLWLGGQETTSNTLAWLIIYLMLNPEIQEKLYTELESVIASDRLITVEDKSSLNYLNAVIAETQRYCNLFPMNVNHRTLKDIEIQGYRIPANTTIIDQISTVLMDERYFPEPQKFKPERFLDKNGKFFQPIELMPFGVGKRACLGEGMARMELYLFTANIFNQFKIMSSSTNPPSTVRKIGVTVQPEPFVAYIENRI